MFLETGFLAAVRYRVGNPEAFLKDISLRSSRIGHLALSSGAFSVEMTVLVLVCGLTGPWAGKKHHCLVNKRRKRNLKPDKAVCDGSVRL